MFKTTNRKRFFAIFIVLIFTLSLCVPFASADDSDTIVFEQTFTDMSANALQAGWTTLDADGDGKNWEIGVFPTGDI